MIFKLVINKITNVIKLDESGNVVNDCVCDFSIFKGKRMVASRRLKLLDYNSAVKLGNLKLEFDSLEEFKNWFKGVFFDTNTANLFLELEELW